MLEFDEDRSVVIKKIIDRIRSLNLFKNMSRQIQQLNDKLVAQICEYEKYKIYYEMEMNLRNGKK
jgi:hypothetical protein